MSPVRNSPPKRSFGRASSAGVVSNGIGGNKGFSLIDLIISIGIITVLFGGIYLVFFSIMDSISNIELRTAATSVLNRHIEIVRNLPYDQVGTVSGIPSGVIQQTQSAAHGDTLFTVKTTVRNIDDPFDGTLGGVPNDTAPSDYKLVEFEISCATCPKFVPLRMTTTVAPKNLESATNQGSIFINVFDANAIGVGTATVRVVNTNVTPTIDLTDTTNASGSLQLVGFPTSTQAYKITVTKSGYSSDKTYAAGDIGGSTPAKPHATVAAQQVTQISFAIDRTGQINVKTSDALCTPIESKNFSVTGAKLIGTNPDYVKFSTSSQTNGSGVATLGALEWDSYAFTFNESSYDLLGIVPLSPFNLNPNMTTDFRFIIQPSDPSSLLITVKNAGTSAPVQNATVVLTKPGFSETLLTGHGTFNQTDWSGGAYISKDADMSAGTSLALTLNASGTYSTVPQALTSNTFDTNGATSTYYSIRWNPNSQPPQVGSDSVKFQIASNNDNATWDFLGPDGTGSSYYAENDSAIISHNNRRYFRYKVFLATANENYTPTLDDVEFEFNGPCVPMGQVLLTGLSNATYTATVNAAGFSEGTSSVVVSGEWQQSEILLNP